jgi:glycosyltransferase involved in cell wall biosynthesis
MDMTDIYIDVTGGTVGFDYLMKYETIFVQRVHSWNSYDVLERVKKAGKRIIYDIDDDIFSIPQSNPSFNSFGRNEQMAAVECMKLADVVVVSTTFLKQRLDTLIPGCKIVVIPNSIDPNDGWIPVNSIGSPDGWKRIFWQGSSTHNEDWNECFEAVQQVMLERKDVRLVLMGFLPTMVQVMAEDPIWKNRIEYMGPVEPEAYFRLIKHLRGEVGLAPLCDNIFNQSKSCIKWMENSMIGMPTAASNIRPYSDVIQTGQNGFLCNTTADWISAIELCLDDSALRKRIVENARNKIKEEFNVKEVAKVWKSLLLGK